MNYLRSHNLDFNKTSIHGLIDQINQSLVPELNIYHQAYLILERPIVESFAIHKVTKYELPITFQIQGHIKATVICLLDTYKKNIISQESSLFQSLYIESMNILLGKTITHLEEKFYYSSILSSPMISSKDTIDQMIKEKKGQLKLSMGYKLTYNKQDFDCRILINLKKQKFSEV